MTDIKNIGILGGGQLGRMLIEAAHNMEKDFKCVVWEPNENACAFDVADEAIIASYEDEKARQKFIKKIDVAVLEFENIPVKIVKQIEQAGKLVVPSSKTLSIVQDRVKEKTFFEKNGIPCVEWYPVNSEETALEAQEKLGVFSFLKTCRFGYDGKGQIAVGGHNSILLAWHNLNKVECIAEEMLNFDIEFSVIGARNKNGEIEIYDIGQNLHENGILKWTEVPAFDLPAHARKKAEKYFKIAIEDLELVGLLAVEMFLDMNGNVLANEMAARPHNSGHWTMDGAKTSQFEQCIRVAADMPLGSRERTHDVLMGNVLGEKINNVRRGDIKGAMTYSKTILYDYNEPHDYKKGEPNEGRKMGHINYIREIKQGGKNEKHKK